MSEAVESILPDNDILDVGETWTYTASYIVTQADIDANIPLINTISVESDEVPGPRTDDVSTPVGGTATISVEKIQTTDAPITDAGQLIVYRIVLTNTGTRSITGVDADEIYPGAGTGLLGAATESISNNGILDVGETWTYRASYRVTQADIDAGANLINTISVVTNEVPRPTTDTVETPVVGTSSMTVVKTQTSTDIITSPGQIITYQIVVTNTGTTSLTNVVAAEDYPGDGAGNLSSPIESVSTNGILNVNETWTYTAEYTVTQADLNTGEDLVNIISVTDPEIPRPVTDEVITEVEGSAELTIEKEVNIDEISAPGILTYTITVENTGTINLTNVVLTDPFATNGPTLTGGDIANPGVLDVDEIWTYTATYNVTQDDIDAGNDLINTATIDTDQTDPEDADATTSVSRDADLTIEKDVDIDEISAPGVLTYTITIENTGNVSLTNVVLTDPFATTVPTLTGGDVANPNVLDVDETWTYTATYIVTQDDIDAGDDLENTAIVDTDQTDPEDADATTSVSQNADLTIEKDVDIDQISAPGVLTYTITVENTGSVSLTNVVLTDPFASTGPILTGGDIANTGVLDVGETWTYTATYNVTRDDIICRRRPGQHRYCRHRSD